MNFIIQFWNFTIEIPYQWKPTALIVFQSLIVFNSVEFKLCRNPRSKFKSNIRMCKGTTISAWFRNYTNCVRAFNPLLKRQCKSIWTRLNSQGVEFDPFKFYIIQLFPKTQKFYSIFTSYPILYNVFRFIAFITCNILKWNKFILKVLSINCNIHTFSMNCLFYRFLHHYISSSFIST